VIQEEDHLLPVLRYIEANPVRAQIVERAVYPDRVVLRFRHPQALPVQSVTVYGHDWKHFNKETETIEPKGLAGTVTVTASY